MSDAKVVYSPKFKESLDELPVRNQLYELIEEPFKRSESPEPEKAPKDTSLPEFLGRSDLAP